MMIILLSPNQSLTHSVMMEIMSPMIRQAIHLGTSLKVRGGMLRMIEILNRIRKKIKLRQKVLRAFGKRGRLISRQYVKNRKSKYGIKFYKHTTYEGYILNMEIYQGRDRNEPMPDRRKYDNEEVTLTDVPRMTSDNGRNDLFNDSGTDFISDSNPSTNGNDDCEIPLPNLLTFQSDQSPRDEENARVLKNLTNIDPLTSTADVEVVDDRRE
ncbi:hypothetical protein JTB14_008488 [Gonioctena quinquepunctata]|nr:hypothetical protein JTB14_008488 [Gonioctena quinquepunctata]